MRYILIFIVLSNCAQDKVLHFGAGAVTSMLVTELTDEPWMGCLSAIGIGVAKEIYDSRTHAADSLDILATGMGCSINIAF